MTRAKYNCELRNAIDRMVPAYTNFRGLSPSFHPLTKQALEFFVLVLQEETRPG